MNAVRNLLMLICCLPCAAGAETPLRDPTRPADVSAAGSADNASGLRLDAVRRPLQGRPEAVINGQTLTPGADILGRRLLSVGDGEVRLRGPDGPETLRLAPEVEKKENPGNEGRPGMRAKAGGRE